MELTTVDKHIRCMQSLLTTLPDIKKETLEQYFVTHLEAGKSKAYLNIVIGTLRHWGVFTKDDSYKELRYFNIGETHKAIMSDEEIDAFLKLPYIHVSNRGNKEAYDTQTLFFKCLAFSGMRPSEVANLTIENVDFGSNLFILEKTKTTPRNVPIAPALIDDLTAHIKKLEGEYLFTRGGKPFTKQMWPDYFNNRIKRLGIKRKKLSTNSLRHSFITRFLDEDVNLYAVQNIVGHKQGSPITAQYYHYGKKRGQTTIKKDPLSRASLPYYDRLKLFRGGVTKLLEDYATSPEEESQMKREIFNS